MGVSARAGDAFGPTSVGTPILGVDRNGNLAPIAGVGADPVATNETGTSGAGAAVTLTYAAETDKAHVIRDVVCSYDTTPTGGGLSIKDGGTDVIFTVDIGAAGINIIPFGYGKQGRAGRAMTVTLAAGGGAVVGKINASHYVVTSIAGGMMDFSDELNSGLYTLFF